MDNKQIPPWEEEPLLPEQSVGDEETVPVIQELDFEAEGADPTVSGDSPVQESTAAIKEEAVLEIQELTMGDLPISSESVVVPIAEYPEEEPAWVSEDPPSEESSEQSFEVPTADDSPVVESEIIAEVLPSPEESVPAAMPEISIMSSPASSEPELDLERDILSDPSLVPMVEEPPAPEEETAEEETAEEYTDAPPPPTTETSDKKKKGSDTRPTLKGRPKRKKGEGFFGIPNILVTFVWLALILGIGVTLGRMLWICAADVLAFGREDKRVTITIYEADTMEQVVDKLHEAGLIRYKSLFNLYASISDAEEDIKPGIYDLNTRYDYHALVKSMSPSSSREVIELTIPEGYSCRQIFALLEEHRVCTAQDIGAYAANGTLSEYWFLEGLERGSEYCLEGYLFPDTYQFYKNSSPREALEKMLDNFENRFTEEMRAQIDVLNANVTDGTYGVREIVIVASLIEKESAAPAESPTIASVIYNRLFNWDYPALLNIDAAIVYAQGGNADQIDTSIDSPYNTYRYTGLTPTAISNPGLASLKAALNPESTGYYYYVLNPSTGMHQFSKTQAEHDAWIDEFYN